MKRIIKLINLLLCCFSLTSCGVKMTTEDYSDYLKINAILDSGEIYDKHFSGASGTVVVEGLSDIYDYSKIQLDVIVYFETKYDDKINEKKLGNVIYKTEVPVKLNVNGDGTGSFEIDFESYYEAINHSTMGPIAKEKPGQYSKYYPIIINWFGKVEKVHGRLKK